jgi:hypothetical protein
LFRQRCCDACALRFRFLNFPLLIADEFLKRESEDVFKGNASSSFSGGLLSSDPGRCVDNIMEVRCD